MRALKLEHMITRDYGSVPVVLGPQPSTWGQAEPPPSASDKP